MISPAKLEANRRNALRSTGPKTCAGKERSSRNAETHGLTSQPGEPTAAFGDSLAEWVADLKPRGVAERTLVERACRAAWNLRRCDRYEDASAFFRDRDAAQSLRSAEADRAEAIGRRLLAWSSGGACEPDKADPAALVGELRRSAAGVRWLLDRWGELRGALAGKGWDLSDRARAALLLGWRPEAADDHPVLGSFVPRSTSTEKPPGGGSWGLVPGCQDALRRSRDLDKHRPGEGAALLEGWMRKVVAQTQPDMDGADRKRLAALVRSEREKLDRLLKRVLTPREDQDEAGAADRATFDGAKSLALCLRYSSAASRDLHRSLRDLSTLRNGQETEDSGSTQTVYAQEDALENPPIEKALEPDEETPTRDADELRNEPTDAAAAVAIATSDEGVWTPELPMCAKKGKILPNSASIGYLDGPLSAIPLPPADVPR